MLYDTVRLGVRDEVPHSPRVALLLLVSRIHVPFGMDWGGNATVERRAPGLAVDQPVLQCKREAVCIYVCVSVSSLPKISMI